VLLYPRRCGSARLRLERRGDLGGEGEEGGVGDFVGCSGVSESET
jgi:hypothetical protein